MNFNMNKNMNFIHITESAGKYYKNIISHSFVDINNKTYTGQVRSFVHKNRSEQRSIRAI